MMANLSAAIPAMVTDNFGLTTGNSYQNTFSAGSGSGEFRAVEAAVTAGQILTFGTVYQYAVARLMAAGYQPLGVALAAAAANSQAPVIEQGYVSVAKTTGTAIPNGATVCTSSATATSVTTCAPGQPVMGSDVDGGSGAASGATVALIDLQSVVQPAIATTSVAGLVKPDGTTITISGGVISASGGGGGSNPTVDLVSSGTSNTYSGTTSAYIKWTSTSTSAKAQAIPACASGLAGVMLVVKDGAGSAGTAGEVIVITPASGTIDGQGTLTISSNYGSAQMFCDGSTTDWSTFGG